MAGDDLTHFPTPTEAFGIRNPPQRRAPHTAQQQPFNQGQQNAQSPRYAQQQFNNGQPWRNEAPLHPSQNVLQHRPSDTSINSNGRSSSAQFTPQPTQQQQYQGNRIPSGQMNNYVNQPQQFNHSLPPQPQPQPQPKFNNVPPIPPQPRMNVPQQLQQQQQQQQFNQTPQHSKPQPIPSPPKTTFPGQQPISSPSTQPSYQPNSQPPPTSQAQVHQRSTSSPDQTALLDRQLRDLFHRLDRDRDGKLNESELQSALSNNDGSQFRSSTVLLMIKIFDKDLSGGVEFKEFFHLWNYITHWRKVFLRYDVDQNQKISFAEYQSALEAIGYRLPTDEALFIFQKFGDVAPNKVMYLNFDMFVESVVWLFRCTNIFKRFDIQGNGVATITFQDFVHEFISFF